MKTKSIIVIIFIVLLFSAAGYLIFTMDDPGTEGEGDLITDPNIDETAGDDGFESANGGSMDASFMDDDAVSGSESTIDASFMDENGDEFEDTGDDPMTDPDEPDQPFEEAVLPEDFPIHQDFEYFANYKRDGRDIYEYHSQEEIQAIYSFYRDTLPAKGFEIVSSDLKSDSAVIESKKGSNAFILEAKEFSGFTEIKIIVN